MSNELYHWGIKGMRWGVRRFQNKDGSLTLAGKKRYVNGSDNEDRQSFTKDEWKKRVLNTHSATELYKYKDLFDDKELMNAYLRLNTEKNIKSLIPAKVSKGEQFINKYVDTSKTIKNVMSTILKMVNLFGVLNFINQTSYFTTRPVRS